MECEKFEYNEKIFSDAGINLAKKDGFHPGILPCDTTSEKKDVASQDFESMTECAAVEFLQARNILPKEILCPKRTHKMILKYHQDNVYWRCRKQRCDSLYSVRRGTWLEGLSLPLKTIILFIYYWVKESTSIQFCKEKLGITHSTIVDYNNHLREVCAEAILKNPIKIGGPNCTVEIDEAVYGKRKYYNNRLRIVPEQLVYGGICRETRDVFLYAFSQKSRETLKSCIMETIIPGTTIFIDNWKMYGIDLMEGYNYKDLNVGNCAYGGNPVDELGNPVDELGHSAVSSCNNQVESTWDSFKKSSKRRCGSKSDKIDSYLCEYIWRRRNQGKDLFEKILKDISEFAMPC